MFSVTIQGGVKICVPDSAALITPYVLLEQEDWFEDEVRFVRRFLQPGMAAVDVGASFGIYSMAMANAVTAKGKVWAFEPTPETSQFLKTSLDLNGACHVQLTRAALSDKSGTVDFLTSPHSELNAVATGSQVRDHVLTVPCLTLDQAAADNGWSGIDFVKLDVEGHEMQVLAGGRSFFARESPLVMFEVTAGNGVDLRPLAPLQAMGYEIYRLVPGPMVLAPFVPGKSTEDFLLNLFACKPDRAKRLATEGLLAVGGDSAIAVSAEEAWHRFLASAPYARGMTKRWSSRQALRVPAHTRTYERALALFAQSRDLQYSAAARLSLLERAAELTASALQDQGTLARLLTSARLEWELGRRSLAAQLLKSAGQRIKMKGEDISDEPFLAPSVRYEQLETGMPANDWVYCAVIEQMEKLQHFSSYYTGTSSLAPLETIAGLPCRSPEMERRRQLIRIRAGLQSGREAIPLLSILSDENLNPALWSGPERG